VQASGTLDVSQLQHLQHVLASAARSCFSAELSPCPAMAAGLELPCWHWDGRALLELPLLAEQGRGPWVRPLPSSVGGRSQLFLSVTQRDTQSVFQGVEEAVNLVVHRDNQDSQVPLASCLAA